jgi:hypothetical protein
LNGAAALRLFLLARSFWFELRAEWQVDRECGGVAQSVQRRNARVGRGAAEHLIGSLRCMYGYLVADGIVTQAENPAARAEKPRRLRSTRMALPGSRLDQLCQVTSTTGNDPAPDALLLRLHMETACGRALALNPDDLGAEQSLIRPPRKARRYADNLYGRH